MCRTTKLTWLWTGSISHVPAAGSWTSSRVRTDSSVALISSSSFVVGVFEVVDPFEGTPR
jgi:hypothetical protein